jgi:hypothetical protein
LDPVVQKIVIYGNVKKIFWTREKNFNKNLITQDLDDQQQQQQKTVSVKSKIKLMESIVQSRVSNSKNERSSSISSSSSSSSSTSSSRSPPISPKTLAQPQTTTRSQKQMAPQAPANTKDSKLIELSVSTEEEPSSSVADDDESTKMVESNPTSQSLSSLKEKRRTVKELMSKFEPK